MVDRDDLEDIYGPAAKWSEYQCGDTITYGYPTTRCPACTSDQLRHGCLFPSRWIGTHTSTTCVCLNVSLFLADLHTRCRAEWVVANTSETEHSICTWCLLLQWASPGVNWQALLW